MNNKKASVSKEAKLNIDETPSTISIMTSLGEGNLCTKELSEDERKKLLLEDKELKPEFKAQIMDKINAKEKLEAMLQGRDKFARIYTMEDSIKLMSSWDYKERFIAEYVQLKIRYEKLKYLLTKWDAMGEKFGQQVARSDEEYEAQLKEWLGFVPSCTYSLLREQQKQMGELLHTLELRAVIEGIDLRGVTVKL